MIDLLRLELRKQRLAFLGMGLTLLASLPLVALSARIFGSEPAEALPALMLFWTVVGLPGTAALLGASAGAGLRAEPAASAESALPVPPGRRAAAALMAAGLQLLLLTALTALLVCLVNADGRGLRMLGQDWAWHFFGRGSLALFGCALAHILILSFAGAYALAHGLAGGLIGLFVGGVAGACLVFVWVIRTLFEHRDLFRPGAAFLLVGVCLGGALYAAHRATTRLERRAGLGRTGGALCALAMLGGGVFCFAALEAVFGRLLRAPQPPWQRDVYVGPSRTAVARRLLPGLDRAEAQGFLGTTLEGDLVLFTPRGERTTLVPGVRRGLRNIFSAPYWNDIRSTEWDEDGSLWVLAERDFEGKRGNVLLHGRPGERFDVHWTEARAVADRIVRRGRELVLLAWTTEGPRYAPIPEKGAEPSWRPFKTERLDLIPNGWIAAGLAAVPAEGRRSVVWKKPGGGVLRWRLPRRAHGSLNDDYDAFPALTRSPIPTFALNMGDKEGVEFALLRPDGSVKIPWPGSPFNVRGLSADGTLWARRDKTTLLMLKPDGEAAAPFDAAPALASLPLRRKADSGMPVLLRAQGGELWLVLAERWLVRVDEAGGTVKARRRLPAAARRVEPVPEGFFLHDGERIFLVDWEGRSKRLT